VEYLRTRPGDDVPVTSIVPGEGPPLRFYRRIGFEVTGERFDHEQLLRLQPAPA
jgi:diamine N-acetyltransferase